MTKTIVPGRVITLEHKKIKLPDGSIEQMDVIGYREI